MYINRNGPKGKMTKGLIQSFGHFNPNLLGLFVGFDSV